MEEKLPENKFARVVVEKINDIHAGEAIMGITSVPIGRVYKNEFLKILSSQKNH